MSYVLTGIGGVRAGCFGVGLVSRARLLFVKNVPVGVVLVGKSDLREAKKGSDKPDGREPTFENTPEPFCNKTRIGLQADRLTPSCG